MDTRHGGAPYLSVIATSRNDDHGGNLPLRMQVFVNSLAAQAKRHSLPTELVLVDWNPPADRPSLADALQWPQDNPWLRVVIVQVPEAIHQRYKYARRLPLYQMIAKNVGIRRATGEYVLCTNVDIVFSDALFAFLASRSLEPGKLYRSERHDVDNCLEMDWNLDRILEHCANSTLRINTLRYSLNTQTGRKHCVYRDDATEESVGRPLLFTNACGDFTLLSREDWFRLQGYVEWDMFSFHLDSLFLYQAHYAGCEEVALPSSMPHYHIEHLEGWTPEIHNAGTMDSRLQQDQISRLSNDDLKALIARMVLQKRPLMANDEDWGLVRQDLPLTVMAEGSRAGGDVLPGCGVDSQDASTADSSDRPYISFVVTTRNDDHGEHACARFQCFLDHLCDMCDRHELHSELIVVEWNPVQDRPALAQAMVWPESPWLDVRIVTVPEKTHNTFENADKFPLFQMIAKNVGVRRAKGEFVLATNIDLLFSDELFAFLALKNLESQCFYRMDRHDISLPFLPGGMSWRERLHRCRENIVRVHAQHGTHAWGAPAPTGDPQRLHSNACGDFTLMAREKWFALKAYPEFALWSIYIDGLLIHAAAALGMEQKILRDPCRQYHMEHGLGWAVTQDTTRDRPSLDYRGEYLPLCERMLAKKKPLDVNPPTWGLSDHELEEHNPHAEMMDTHMPYQHYIDVLAAIDRRLYYRDQDAKSLCSLADLAKKLNPTVIVELGTLSGLSLRTWLKALPEAHIHAVDLSFKKLRETREYFPFEDGNVTYHEKNILDMDFPSLWKEADKVLFFVDAHDLHNVPIMRHVLDTALPHLPKGSLVVVDDVWRSGTVIDKENAQQYFDDVLLGEIDELQCFTGFYSSYHGGGSFIGFREVIPLLEFVNDRGIELGFEAEGKHVWFEWDGERHTRAASQGPVSEKPITGFVSYNPLKLDTTAPLASKILPAAAKLYKDGKLNDALTLLTDLINKEQTPETCLAMAFVLARIGRPEFALQVLGMLQGQDGGWRAERLRRGIESMFGLNDLVPRTGKPGLTLFAMPKAFDGHTGLIQRNAIRSWRALGEDVEIILLGNDSGTAEMAREVGALHIPNIAVNEFGTPLVDDMFRRAAEAAGHDVLAYINADIILLDGFLDAVRTAQTSLDEFLIIGQRWDLTVTEEINFASPSWDRELRLALETDGYKHAECGQDYFVHSKNLWPSILPFALGRCAFDNWLVAEVLRLGKPVIDGTEFVTAIHQEHSYNHVAGGRQSAFHGAEAVRNRAMSGPLNGMGYINKAGLKLTQSGELVENPVTELKFILPEVKSQRMEWLIKQAQRLKKEGYDDLADAKYQEVRSLKESMK